MTTCLHENFEADVAVNRLCKTEGGPITSFIAEVKIRCTQCDTPFQFLGLEGGCDTQGARVTVDGLEAILAISPEGVQPNPFQKISYSIKGFDG